jgi:hypothetical protein
MIERKRDLSNLSEEQYQALQAKLSAKLSEILEKAGKEANLLLNQYGVEVKIGYSLKDQNSSKKSRKS